MEDLEKQADVRIKLGVTKLIAEDNNQHLITIELTPNMIVMHDNTDTVFLRAWRHILQWYADGRKEHLNG